MSRTNIPWSVETAALRDMVEWRNFNRYRKQFKLPIPHKDILFYSERPIRFCLSICLLAFLCWTLWVAEIRGDSQFWWSTSDDADHITYFTTLWSIQVTLAALVYPVVIALVAIFLQSRPASRTHLQLYIIDTGALIAGLSALSLVVAMSIQYLVLGIIGPGRFLGWAVVDSAWFVINTLLTAFFLYRTLEFLRPGAQSSALRRYAINVALPRDVLTAHKSHLLRSAISRGWIPARDALDENAASGPKIEFRSLGFGDSRIAASITLSTLSRLSDVRIWFLRAALLGWVRAARSWQSEAGADDPVLSVLVNVGDEYQGSVDLVRVQNGPSLSWWQQFLLRRSVVFVSVARERHHISVSEILGELRSDASKGISSKDLSSFERAYNELLAIHKLLLGAALFKMESGALDSCARLPDPNAIFERQMHVQWAEAYRDILHGAVEEYVAEPQPLKRLCYLINHLHGGALSQSPVAIREHLYRLPSLLMHYLGMWWEREIGRQRVGEHGRHKMVVLNAPESNAYKEILSNFVGGWEASRSIAGSALDSDDGFSWDAVEETVRLSAFHLEQTGRMLLSAVNRGDLEASEWLVDVLSKWWNEFRHERDPIVLYGKTQFLTLDDLRSDWTKLADEIGLTEEDVNWEGMPLAGIQRGVALAALHNFWTDIRLVVLEILISWTDPKDGDGSLATHIAAGLLAGKQWRGGGHQSDGLSSLSASRYLTAKARQYVSDESGKYRARLDDFVERVRDSLRPQMVSGRVYSWVGSDNLSSLESAHSDLFVYLSSPDWHASESLLRQTDIWMSTSPDRVERLDRTISRWLDNLRADRSVDNLRVDAILAAAGRNSDAGASAALAVSALAEFQGFLKRRHQELIAQAPIDIERLNQIAAYASERGFGPSGEFPLALFGAIEYVEHELVPFTLRNKKVRKGELTRQEFEQRAANESSFWAETMANHVGALVLSDAIRAGRGEDFSVSDAKSYWMVLRREAKRLIDSGETPILLLENPTRPEWVWSWQYGNEFDPNYWKPDDLHIGRETGRGRGYICNFSDIRVYRAPLPSGQSILLPSSFFRKVSFQEFGENRFVSASTEARADSSQLVDLLLKLSRKVEVADTSFCRLQYEVDDDPVDPKA